MKYDDLHEKWLLSDDKTSRSPYRESQIVILDTSSTDGVNFRCM